MRVKPFLLTARSILLETFDKYGLETLAAVVASEQVPDGTKDRCQYAAKILGVTNPTRRQLKEYDPLVEKPWTPWFPPRKPIKDSGDKARPDPEDPTKEEKEDTE